MSFEELSKLLKGKVSLNEPLASYTSFGLGGPAKLLAHPADEEDLENILDFARQEGMRILVLGMGTNLLVKDSGFPGMVIRLTDGLKGIHRAPEGIEVGAGTEARDVLDYCLHRGLQGMECFAGIPGSIGGMIKTNAGAFGDELGFGYRSSNLPNGLLITRAWPRLKEGKREEIKRQARENLKLKAKTQPLSQRSAGCIFKNPAQTPAAKLIQEVGGKGMRVGEAMVSPIHANFIVNLGGATASQVLLLIDQLRERVREAFRLTLELEVEIVGGEE